MNRELRFYNYEQCFAHYTKRIMNIRQAKVHGEVIVAKPVLLLALIEGKKEAEPKLMDSAFFIHKVSVPLALPSLVSRF